MTKMAAQIWRIINNSMEHLTAEQIFLECKRCGIKCSVASVYRNLANLVSDGCIKKVSILGEPDRYDKSVSPHEHLLCEKCRHVCDVKADDLKQLLEKHLGVEITSYDLSMKYICPECRKKSGF